MPRCDLEHRYRVDRKEYNKVIEKAMHHLSAEQQRWFIRIVLKGESDYLILRSDLPLPNC